MIVFLYVCFEVIDDTPGCVRECILQLSQCLCFCMCVCVTKMFVCVRDCKYACVGASMRVFVCVSVGACMCGDTWRKVATAGVATH